MNTRWVTIGFALLLAFTLHLDSVAVLKQLTEDSDPRSQARGDVGVAARTVTDVGRDRGDSLHGDAQELSGQWGQVQLRRHGSFGVDDRQAIRCGRLDWHECELTERDGLIKTYNVAVDKKLTESLNKSIDRAKTLQGSLASAGIALPPPNHTDKDWFSGDRTHLAGMLVSAPFLSLGAPFWFNLLKNLTSLKSAVTTKPRTAEPATRVRALAPPSPAPTLPALPQATANWVV